MIGAIDDHHVKIFGVRRSDVRRVLSALRLSRRGSCPHHYHAEWRARHAVTEPGSVKASSAYSEKVSSPTKPPRGCRRLGRAGCD